MFERGDIVKLTNKSHKPSRANPLIGSEHECKEIVSSLSSFSQKVQVM